MTISELKELLSQNKEKKICIWGAGAYGKIGYGLLKTLDRTADFFCDNNAALWGKEIVDGLICLTPEELEAQKDEVICFVMIQKRSDCDDIYLWLKRKGFQKIVCRYDIFDAGRTVDFIQQISRQMIGDFYVQNPRKNTYRPLKGKGVVYTCVAGGYDEIDEPQILNPNYDYYYIAEAPIESIHNMKFLDINSLVPDGITKNVMKARYCKVHPHLIFQEYDFSIYFDGKLKLIKDCTEIPPLMGKPKTGIAGFRHPDRDCVFKEGIACTILRKAEKEDILQQLNRYLEEGMPYQYGMVDTCFLIRKHHEEACIRIMEDWWKEILQNTHRDQLSFPYCLWKNGFLFSDIFFIPFELVGNKYFKIKQHK